LTRPADWAPLAGSDPLTGSPEEILEQAARLRATAGELTWQVKTLRGIGVDGQLTGGYADALRTAATDLATRLEKVIHRYTETARCLNGWAPELAEFQATTVALLRQAQDIERAAGLLHEAEDRGRYWAHLIAEAIDDELTDGFWDRVHGWVENHKEQLEKYTSRLGWVATIAAVGALAVPGLNVAVLGVGLLDAVAIGSTGTLLATHTVMAAEGQGSWWEVGIDAAALASFGYGRYLGKGIGRAAEATKEAGAEAAGREAAERYATMTREQLTEQMESAASDAQRAAARRAYRRIDRDALRIADDAMQTARAAPETGAGLLQRLAAGSKEDADAVANASHLLAEHPGDPAVRDAAAQVRRLAAQGRKNWWVAAGLDTSDKALNRYWAGSYRGFKEHFTAGIGWLQ
jgi:hypothetical protein